MMVCIDGLDAAGKNTQAKMLAERIDRTGNIAVVMSFPRYETDVGRVIRRMLIEDVSVRQRVEGLHDSPSGYDYISASGVDVLVLQALFLADKYDAAPEIRAALRKGHTVVCDRWIPSCIAFGAADGLPVDWLVRIQDQLPQPDLNIFIDVPESEALKRRPQMRDRYEKDRNKQEVIRDNYTRLWAARSVQPPVNGRWVTVSGLGTPDEVNARVWAEVVALAPRMR